MTRPGPIPGRSAAFRLALGLALVAPPLGLHAALDQPIIVTQAPRTSTRPFDPFADSRLLWVPTNGAPRVLTGDFASACDPNVSFDGAKVLFAGRAKPGDFWRIYEYDLAGATVRPVSPPQLEARNPIHVSTLFTLDSPQPWFTTVFAGRDTTPGAAGVPALYNIKLDGTELRQLTFGPAASREPFQMWDGRIIYSAERRPFEPGVEPGHVRLHAIHMEGADMELYGGERGGAVQRMACGTEGGHVVFVEPDPARADGAGQLARLDEQRPHVTYHPLTRDARFAYAYPSPAGGNRLLVARHAKGGRGDAAIVSLDAVSARTEVVFDTPEYRELQAVIVAPRRRPDGHSTVVDTKFKTGIFYGLNCYDAEARMAPHLTTGMVKRVRLAEGIVLPAAPGPKGAKPGTSVTIVRRLVGEAPVATDGSFNLEVPADTPLLLQSLDERGMALATCGWIWVKPGEKRGCIGCHEDPERIPENEYVIALRHPSTHLDLPPAERRTVTFRDDIAPLLAKHCATAGCHADKKSPRLALRGGETAEPALRAAYQALMTPAKDQSRVGDGLPAGRYIDAGRARTSRLIWMLAGENTSRPWDQSPHMKAKPADFPSMPPTGKGTPLTPDELRILIQWIDLGAPYTAPKAANSQP